MVLLQTFIFEHVSFGFQNRQAAEIRQLQDEMEEMKELLHTYEQTLSRKDQVITNLTTGIQKSKEKLQLAHTFSDWKLSHSDSKREVWITR